MRFVLRSLQREQLLFGLTPMRLNPGCQPDNLLVFKPWAMNEA